MSESSPFAKVVEQVVSGSAPRQVRSAAARGALPLPRHLLARLFVALLADSDEEIRSEAAGSIDALDEEALIEVLGEKECAPEVLDHFAERAAREEKIAEKIVFHPAVSEQALTVLAGKGSGEVLELILTNQERLLKTPGVLDTMTVNPAMRPAQQARLLDLLNRVSRAGSGARTGDDAATAEGEMSEGELAEVAQVLDIDVGELFAASEIVDGEEFEQSEDAQVRSAYKRILALNVAQKAMLAMKGGREERMILVRDTNKVVAQAALRNPRITDDDVEFIARMRNVSTDVLRSIGQNREWTKGYNIIMALVQNPRTPPGLATNFVTRLRSDHLKRLTRNHDIPELIRRMAKRTIQNRQPSGRLKR